MNKKRRTPWPMVQLDMIAAFITAPLWTTHKLSVSARSAAGLHWWVAAQKLAVTADAAASPA
jgi:hypothetical protein